MGGVTVQSRRSDHCRLGGVWPQGHLRGHHRVSGFQDKAGPALGGKQGVGVAALLPGHVGLVGVLVEGGSPRFDPQEQTAWPLHPALPPRHSETTEGEGEVDVVPGEGAGLLPVQGPDLLRHRHRCHHSLAWTEVTLGSNQHNGGRARPSHLEEQGHQLDLGIEPAHLCCSTSEPLQAPSSIAEKHHRAVPVDQRPERRIARQPRSVPHCHTHRLATHPQQTLHLVETSPCVNLEKRTLVGDEVGKTRGGCYEFMGTENKILEQFRESQNNVKMGIISLQYLGEIYFLITEGRNWCAGN